MALPALLPLVGAGAGAMLAPAGEALAGAALGLGVGGAAGGLMGGGGSKGGRAGSSSMYPYGYNGQGLWGKGGQEEQGYNPYEMPTYEMPKQPTAYIYPEGRMDLINNQWIYSDSPEIAKEKKDRRDMINRLYAELKEENPERAKEIEEYGKQYEKDFLKEAQPLTEQALIGRGLGGSSIYKEAVTDLTSKASEGAIKARESLKKSDEASILNTIASLQGGVNADVAAGQQTSALSNARSALDNQIASEILNAKIAAQNQASQNYWNSQQLGYNYWNANNLNDRYDKENMWRGISTVGSFLPFMFGMGATSSPRSYSLDYPNMFSLNGGAGGYGGWSNPSGINSPGMYRAYRNFGRY